MLGSNLVLAFTWPSFCTKLPLLHPAWAVTSSLMHLPCNCAAKDLWQMNRMATVCYFINILPRSIIKHASNALCILSNEKQFGYITMGSTGKHQLRNLPDIKSWYEMTKRMLAFVREGQLKALITAGINFPGNKFFLLLPTIVFNQKLHYGALCF